MTVPVICEKCDVIPNILPDDGRLYLWPPVAHSGGKIVSQLKRHDFPFAHNDGLTTINAGFANGNLPGLLEVACAGLLPEEMADTKALLITGGAEPGLDDIANITTLTAILARVRANWLVDVLQQHRLTSVFQPIFAISQLDHPYAHECLIRAQSAEGRTIMPGELFGAAQSADLLFQLDRAARAANVRNARTAGISGNLFINFTPSSIYDPNSCLQSTIAVVNECGIDRHNIVFEVIETEKIRNIEHLGGILQKYRDSGFRVALDDVGSGYSTLNMLPLLRPDIIKIDRELIDRIDGDRYKQAIVSKLVDLAKQLDIEVVAEGIERQEELDFLMTIDVDYVQGFLLGRPAAQPFAA